MAILLTQENVFHHVLKKFKPSEYKTKVINITGIPKIHKKQQHNKPEIQTDIF